VKSQYSAPRSNAAPSQPGRYRDAFITAAIPLPPAHRVGEFS
jgi:hypothetical protein